MKVNNLTKFDTARLREIAQRVAEAELEPHQRAGMTVHFLIRKARGTEANRARRDCFYRRAVGVLPEGLRYNQAIVSIPGDAATFDSGRRAAQTALLLAHEFAEALGLRHENMRSKRYDWKDGWTDFYGWAYDLPIILKAPKAAPSPDDVKSKKLTHARAMHKRALTRAKRAASIVKRWERRIRYYEKQAFSPPRDASRRDASPHGASHRNATQLAASPLAASSLVASQRNASEEVGG